MLQQPASVVWAIIIPGGINPIHVRSKQLLTSSPGKQNFARPPILSCSASASNWVFFHSMSVYVWQCPLPVLFSRFNASDSFCRFIYDAMSSLFINRSPRNPQKWIHLVLATTPASLLTRIHLNLTVLSRRNCKLSHVPPYFSSIPRFFIGSHYTKFLEC